MDHLPPIPPPLLHSRVPNRSAATAPLRACLLSGGSSRRMGTDKALLPHPEGGTWLERSLRLLGELAMPVSLLSRHPEHLRLARQHATTDAAAAGAANPGPAPLEILAEPPPWEGPLLALHRLMERHPDQRLLLCPVDMPDLTLSALLALRRAADGAPSAIHIAQSDGGLQPLLAVLPAEAALRQHLAAAVLGGERRLQRWLLQHSYRPVALEAQALNNCNRPEDIGHRPDAINPTAAAADRFNPLGKVDRNGVG